jgi:uncharacterized protein YuzE
MKIEYNPEYDVLYIKFKKARQVTCVEVTELVTADIDGKGHLVGLEVVDASRQFGMRNCTAVDFAGLVAPAKGRTTAGAAKHGVPA